MSKNNTKILNRAINDERFLVTIAGRNYQDLIQAIAKMLEKNKWLQAELKITRRQTKRFAKHNKELKEELVSVRPYSDCYKIVCKRLGIEKDILGYIKKLKKKQIK